MQCTFQLWSGDSKYSVLSLLNYRRASEKSHDGNINRMPSADKKKKMFYFEIHVSAICQGQTSPFSMFIYVISAKINLILSHFQFKAVHCFSSYHYVTHCLSEYNKWKNFVTPIFFCLRSNTIEIYYHYFAPTLSFTQSTSLQILVKQRLTSFI